MNGEQDILLTSHAGRSQMNNERFCRDCKYYAETTGLCKKMYIIKKELDIVTGELIEVKYPLNGGSPIYASIQRSIIPSRFAFIDRLVFGNSVCTRKGRYWEPK